MERYTLENIGRQKIAAYIPPRVKYVNVIIFKNLSEKKVIKRGTLPMAYKAGNYDYTKDIQELFLQNCKLRTFVTRKKVRSMFEYHVYLSY